MTFAEHQAINAEWAQQYPHQQSWNAEACKKFLETRPVGRVVELGGWDGALADRMLNEFDWIDEWVNYDLTPGVPQVCTDRRYRKIELQHWPYISQVKGDALVASHVFEHMLATEIEWLLEAWDVESVYMDVPIGADPSDWRGYHGSHILEVGHVELLRRCRDLGYKVTHADTHDGLIAFLDREEA